MATQPNITGDLSYTPTSLPNVPQGTLAGTLNLSGDAASVLRQIASGPTAVTLERSATPATADQALWIAIRNRTDAIGFPRYSAFIHRLLCERADPGVPTCAEPEPASAGSFGVPSVDERIDELMIRPAIYGSDAYYLLKLATQAFLAFEGGTAINPPRFGGAGSVTAGEEARLGRPITLLEAQAQLEAYLTTQIGTVGGRALPYLKRVVDALIPANARAEGSPFCDGLLRHRLRCPAMLELIHSYWIEQGALMQTMNAVLLRFQNRRRGERDPLVNLAVDPLQAMSNLLWGRVQDEPQLLSLRRRVHEYQYAYGLTLHGKAVGDLAPVESRTQFLPAFHRLLHKLAEFYAADAFTTVQADGFQVLQALKDLHVVISESANNQHFEVTRQARAETLVDQYLIARNEMRAFLRGRAMVPTAEAWIPQVQTMKQLQGWAPHLAVSHFHTLAATGEQLLQAVRWGDWSVQNDATTAKNFARYWTAEARSYMHSYATVTGVDLSVPITDTRRAEDRYAQPSLHMMQPRLPRPEPMSLAFEAVDALDRVPR